MQRLFRNSFGPSGVLHQASVGMVSITRRRLVSESLIVSRALVKASCDRWRSIVIRAICPADSINCKSRLVGTRGCEYPIQNVPSTSPEFEIKGSDQAARNP